MKKLSKTTKAELKKSVAYKKRPCNIFINPRKLLSELDFKSSHSKVVYRIAVVNGGSLEALDKDKELICNS